MSPAADNSTGTAPADDERRMTPIYVAVVIVEVVVLLGLWAFQTYFG